MWRDCREPTHPRVIGIDVIAGIVNKHKLFHFLSFVAALHGNCKVRTAKVGGEKYLVKS